jgi:hypothetical protein
VKMSGRVASLGPRAGTDARQPQRIRPLIILLVLFVLVIGAIFGGLFFASSTTKDEVRHLVQEKCGLSSSQVAGSVDIDGAARVPYVDSTGSHIAIVGIGQDGSYSLDDLFQGVSGRRRAGIA